MGYYRRGDPETGMGLLVLGCFVLLILLALALLIFGASVAGAAQEPTHIPTVTASPYLTLTPSATFEPSGDHLSGKPTEPPTPSLITTPGRVTLPTTGAPTGEGLLALFGAGIVFSVVGVVLAEIAKWQVESQPRDD